MALGLPLASGLSEGVTPSVSYDVAIVGAGLAGSAAAILLARAGYSVALLERDFFPRHKLCGEFLSGESRRLLAELGCYDAVRALAPPEIDRMDFLTARGTRLDVPLPTPALGLSRWNLDALLAARAREAGADLSERTDVQAVELGPEGAHLQARIAGPSGTSRELRIGARLFIGAYGRVSKLDSQLQRDRQTPSAVAYVGFKRHHLPQGPEVLRQLHRRGEMYLYSGGYCGVAPVESGRVNVCILLEKEVARAVAPHGTWDEIASGIGQRCPGLAQRLSTLYPCTQSPMSAAAPVSFEIRPPASGGAFFAGDAAGMIAPLCGDGQAMALEGGIELARLLARYPAPQWLPRHPELLAAWTKMWTKQYRRRLLLGRWLQNMILHPSFADPALQALAHLPGAAAALARATRGR